MAIKSREHDTRMRANLVNIISQQEVHNGGLKAMAFYFHFLDEGVSLWSIEISSTKLRWYPFLSGKTTPNMRSILANWPSFNILYCGLTTWGTSWQYLLGMSAHSKVPTTLNNKTYCVESRALQTKVLVLYGHYQLASMCGATITTTTTITTYYYN